MRSARILVLCLILTGSLIAKDHNLTIVNGQGQVLTVSNPIKRVSITNPDIADASIISARQLLINGKSLGSTSLIVWDDSESYALYHVKVQNERAAYKITLQVHFAEVNKTVLKEFGTDFFIKNLKLGTEKTDFGSFSGRVSRPNDPLLLGETVDLFLSVPGRQISTIIRALEEKNMLSILAKPNLTTVDGVEASFLAGGEFPIPIVSGAAGMQTVTVQFKEYGVKLRFTPTVLDSNLINIKVAAEVSNLDFENGVTLGGFSVPSLNTRKAETTVELAQNQFFVIGGLLSSDLAKSISKIPLVGSIPVLGKLFSSTHYQNKESELIILVSPKFSSSIQEKDIPKLKAE
jgi:pilus assembly protein CpaC